jgi:hypothetical protein
MLLTLCASVPLGAGLILTLPAGAHLRIYVGLAWGACCLHDCWIVASSLRRFDAIRIASDGATELHEPDAGWTGAALQDGSIVTRQFGWLRCIDEKGRKCPLIVTRRSCQSETWRRFQVLWRHLGEGH